MTSTSNNPMHLCLVSQEYPPETAHGGIGTQTYLKAHGLSALGHRVHVISRSTDACRHVSQDGPVQVIRIPGLESELQLHTQEADWIAYSVRVACEIESLHKNDPIDLIDFPEWAAEGYMHLLSRGEWASMPAVIQLHGPLVMFAQQVGWPDVKSEFYRIGSSMEGTCLRLADATFSSSACSADWCARSYGINRAAIPVLHTGVDRSLFRPLPVPKAERPTVIFMGRITGDKGVPSLVEAASLLAREIPDLHLRLLGRGDAPLIEELRRKLRDRGQEALVDFAGFVDRRDLPEHLSRAHVFAAPSQYEPGPGLVNLEAMACGLPVIATSGAGAAEVVTHETTGLLVPPGDVPALAASLRRLLANPDDAARFSRQSLDYVRDHADSAACIRQIESFYRSVRSQFESPR